MLLLEEDPASVEATALGILWLSRDPSLLSWFGKRAHAWRPVVPRPVFGEEHTQAFLRGAAAARRLRPHASGVYPLACWWFLAHLDSPPAPGLVRDLIRLLPRSDANLARDIRMFCGVEPVLLRGSVDRDVARSPWIGDIERRRIMRSTPRVPLGTEILMGELDLITTAERAIHGTLARWFGPRWRGRVRSWKVSRDARGALLLTEPGPNKEILLTLIHASDASRERAARPYEWSPDLLEKMRVLPEMRT